MTEQEFKFALLETTLSNYEKLLVIYPGLSFDEIYKNVCKLVDVSVNITTNKKELIKEAIVETASNFNPIVTQIPRFDD